MLATDGRGSRSRWLLFPWMVALLTGCPSSPDLLPVRGIPERELGLTVVAGDAVVAATWDWEPVDGLQLSVFTEVVGGGLSRTATYPMFGSSQLFVDSDVENGRTYRYRIVVSDYSWTPKMQSPPVLATPMAGATACLTLAPTAITDTSLTVNGLVVNPAGRTTSVSFDAGSTSTYGTSMAASSTAVTGASQVSYTVTPLPDDTEHHFRIVAQNADGICRGSDRVARTWRSPEVLASGLNASAGLMLGTDTVYFADPSANRIVKVAKSGGVPQTLVTANSPSSLTGDESVLYSAESSGIRRIDLQDLSSAVLSTGYVGGQDYGLALAGSHLYWRRPVEGIYGLPVAGGTPAKIVTGTGVVNDFAIDGNAVYWSENAVVWKRSLEPGAQAVALVDSGSGSNASMVVVAGGWVYYGAGAYDRGICRVSVNGGAPERLTLTAASPGAADATHLYWVDGPLIRKMPLAGGEITTLAYGGGAANPYIRTLAVDDTHVYWSRMDGITPGTGAILRTPKD
jgi:hypothetical protein